MKKVTSKLSTRKTILQIFFLTSIFSVVVHAQELKQMSPNELLSKGTELMKKQKNWRQAELYLYAYLQLNTSYYQSNSGLQEELQRSLKELSDANTGAGAYGKADGYNAPVKAIPNSLSNYQDNSKGGGGVTVGPPPPYTGVSKSIKTGTYTCNDQGTYYVTCIGNKVWWFGKADNGVFTNVLFGTISNDIVRGQWADVPMAQTHGNGTISLQIKNPNEFIQISQTGGFGGTSWKLQANKMNKVGVANIKN